MKKIDITTTATLRPELLKKTFGSFCKNLFINEKRYRLIINIDLVGEEYQPLDVIHVAREFFSDVVYNISKEPSCPKAWKWCWDQVTADFVFHLEEDWELLRFVNIDHMVEILNKNKTLATLRMPKIDIRTLKFFRSRYEIKDGFLQAENKGVSFGGNPQLIKGEFVKATRDIIKMHIHPEKQFRENNKKMYDILKKWDYAIYAKLGGDMLVRDIGRDWMRKHGLQKKGGTTFTEWEKIK